MAQDSANPSKPIREIVHPKPGGAAHGPGIVPGVKAAGLIFFSAIRGNAPGVPMSDDTAEQAQQAFVNLKLLLEGAGATLDHVAHVALYLQDVDYRNAFHKVWMEHFPKRYPQKVCKQSGGVASV